MRLKFVPTLFFSLVFLIASNSHAQSNSYSFFVAGHVYGAPGVNNVGMHPEFKALFPFFQSDTTMKLGVLTGDIVSPNPVAQDWDEIDSDVVDLGIPVHYTVGNHDMENRPLYESRYGQTYYSIVENNDLFFFLDSDIDGWSIQGEQLKFVANTLDSIADEVDNIYVFVHHLIWIIGNPKYENVAPNSFASIGPSVNFWTDIEPLFRSYGKNTIFFAGDVGAAPWSSDFMYDSYDNITLVASGMGEADGENFVIVRKSDQNEVTVELLCLDNPPTQCFGPIKSYAPPVDSCYIYPNPASDFIRLLNVPSDVRIETKITALSGKTVQSKVFEPNTTRQLNTSELSAGYYFLEVKLPYENKTFRFKVH